MARLPSRAGPGLVCYASVVQPLGAVLSNGAAPTRPGQWHSVRPLHGTPGTAILTRPEAARRTRDARAEAAPEAEVVGCVQGSGVRADSHGGGARFGVHRASWF